jgi:tetratricopeptide (TPR) repeat protein
MSSTCRPLHVLALQLLLATALLAASVPLHGNRAAAGPSPAAPPDAAAPAGDLARGYDLLLDDQVLEADRLAARALARDPKDPAALLLSGVVHIYYLELERAGKLLERAASSSRRDAWLHVRRGDLQMALGNFKAAEEQYRRAITLAPALALAHLNLAATLIQDQRVDEGKSAVQRAVGLGIRTREERITHVLTQFLLGDLETTRRLVDGYRKDHGDSSTIVFILAMLELRSGQFELSSTLLEKAAEKGIQNPSLIFQVANLYLALNRVAEAHRLLVRGCKLFPSSAKLADQFKLVNARFFSSEKMTARTDGPFEIRHERSTPRRLLDKIVRLCRKAYRNLAARLDYNPPRIRLQIYDSTGFAAPAYYNNLTGEIIVSGRFFQQASGSMESFVDHAIQHELAHLFLWDRRRGSTRSVNCLWIDEGLAEWLAGGVRYLRELDIDFGAIFTDGPLSMSDLIGNINILWHDNKKNVKAYVQSFFMVDYLMSRVPPAESLPRIGALLERVARDIPLEQAIPEVYGITYDAFVAGWQKHIKDSIPRYR